jgi:hypothetical protein
MKPTDGPRPPDSVWVNILTWVALPFVFTWMTMRSLVSALGRVARSAIDVIRAGAQALAAMARRLGSRILAVLRAGAQALAAMARRIGAASRVTLTTMADGLRRIGGRMLVLARATAQLLARPLRLVLAAARRFGSRLFARAVVLYFDAIRLVKIVVVTSYQLTRTFVRPIVSRIAVVAGLVADHGRRVLGLVATASRRVFRVAGDIVAATWALASRAARSARRVLVAVVVMVWTPLRSGITRAARVASGLVTSGWTVFAGAARSVWRVARSVVSTTWATVTRAARAAGVWVSGVLGAARRVVIRFVFPVVRAALLPVGAVILVTVNAVSKARSLVASIRLALTTSFGRAAQRIRRTASALGAASSQSIRRATASIRSTTSSLRAAVAQSVSRARVSTRRTVDPVRLAIRGAQESVSAAIHAARESLRGVRQKGPTGTHESPKHTRRH